MKIGVIGVGVVGQAVLDVFKDRGVESVGYDPAKPALGTFEATLDSDVLFLCLPTPTVNGAQDLSAIDDSVAKLKAANFKGAVCIKSTVVPGTTASLRGRSGLDICHNPEFLTAATPKADFEAQRAVVIGGPESATSVVAKAYLAADFHVIKQYNSSTTTEMAKYMHNVFLSTKLSIFNEFHEFCKAANVDYNEAKDAALAQDQIGAGHTRVPGPDGSVGWGGMCFVKDTLAFLDAQQQLGLSAEVNKAIITQNKRLRPQEYK